jgi:hypothetical protein
MYCLSTTEKFPRIAKLKGKKNGKIDPEFSIFA